MQFSITQREKAQQESQNKPFCPRLVRINVAQIRKISLEMRVFVILLLPLHRIWKIGRVIECAGLEIRYTPFGYRGFESLIFRKHFNKPKGMFHLAKQIRIAVRLTFYSDFCFLFASTPLLINTRKPNNSRIKQINNLQTQKVINP